MITKVRKRDILFYSSVIVVKLLILGSVSYFCFTTVIKFHKVLPQPVQIQQYAIDPRIEKLSTVVKYLGCPEEKVQKMVMAILDGADKIGVDPILIAALIRTESDFDQSAVSSKGYKGLMQTPVATKQWEDVDILIGCRILEEKIKFAKGDIELALALYKGGNNPAAKKQAKQVLSLYKRIKEL